MNTFKEIHAAAKEKVKNSGSFKAGILAPSRPEHFKATKRGIEEGYIAPIFLGDKDEITALLASEGLNPGDCQVIESKNPLDDGLSMAATGKVQLLMNGGITVREMADHIGRPNLHFASEGKIASHIGVMEISGYHKLLLVTDSVSVQSPQTTDRISIMENAAAVARLIGIPRAKAALLAAVEAIYPAVPVTMEEAAIAKMGERGQIKDLIIDGPLSFDCAINEEVAHQKGIKNSPVAGDTDIFITPTIETANGIYKALVMYARANAGGLIYGGKVPVATAFEVDSADNILNSIALAVLAAAG